MRATLIDEHHRAQVGLDPVLLEQRTAQLALQRRELEARGRVVVDHKVDEPAGSITKCTASPSLPPVRCHRRRRRRRVVVVVIVVVVVVIVVVVVVILEG